MNPTNRTNNLEEILTAEILPYMSVLKTQKLVEKLAPQIQQYYLDMLPEKKKPYPIKIVSKDNPREVWDSSITHGLTPRDERFNAAIDQISNKIKGDE